MSYEWLDEYCLGKVNAVKDYKMEWEAFRYLIGGKMFAMQGEDKEKNPIISLKCDPLYGESLRKEYQHIAPGYYLNKEHWNSVNLDGDVPDEVLKQMIDMSYDLVVKTFSKKKQRAEGLLRKT